MKPPTDGINEYRDCQGAGRAPRHPTQSVVGPLSGTDFPVGQSHNRSLTHTPRDRASRRRGMPATTASIAAIIRYPFRHVNSENDLGNNRTP